MSKWTTFDLQDRKATLSLILYRRVTVLQMAIYLFLHNLITSVSKDERSLNYLVFLMTIDIQLFIYDRLFTISSEETFFQIF